MRIGDEQKLIMVRPTLIVGLGGTGVLICAWVEKYIKALLGCVPPFIRFLKLDTDAVEEGGPANAGKSDFFNLLHYMDVGEVVRDLKKHHEMHPHLNWLRGFPLDGAFADYGCQGIPRLGRLVFVELRDTVIHEAAANRFGDLRSSTQKVFENDMRQFQVAPDGAPAVHIACSVCGGTGAGMLIDMAYNLRWWSRESFPRAAEIIGHLMLPEAFAVDPLLRPKLEAVAGATLEEIEFLTNSERDDMPVCYKHEERDFETMTPPLDLMYLLNGRGDTGVGNRKHLVRMIARVIRSMTIEPMAQHVISDANNKRNDILGLSDVEGRRQCFATYGFWYGRPGHRSGDVDTWICTALEATLADAPAGGRDYADEIEEAAAGALSGDVRGIGRAEDFRWTPPETDPDDVRWEASVHKTLKTYLDDTVRKSLDGAAAEAWPPDKPLRELLDTQEVQVQRDVRDSTLPWSRVGACLGQWIEYLGRYVQDHRVDQSAEKTVLRELRAAVDAGLDGLKRKTLPRDWTSHDVESCVGAALTAERWKALGEAFLRRNQLKSIEETLKVLQVRWQALKSLVKVAATRYLEAGVSGREEDARNERSTEDAELFSIPIYTASESLFRTDDDLGRQFRQELIGPILHDVLFGLKEAAEDEGHVTHVQRVLQHVVRALSEKRKAFLERAEQQYARIFHSPVPADKPIAEHPYYVPVCKVWEFAEPKIDLSRTGRYAKPLDVGISQQRKETCVGELLAYHIGSAFREAHVTEAYESNQRTCFQLLRLRYGFCLPALSTYDNYTEACKDYVARRRFSYADVWLDHTWYSAYCAAKLRWKERRTGSGQDGRIDRAQYDASAQRIGSVAHCMQRTFEGALKHIRRMHDVARVIEVTRKHNQAEMQVNEIIGALSLSDPVGVTAGQKKALTLLGRFLGELEELRASCGEYDQSVLEDAVRLARQELNLMPSAD